jgi:hypothetical protein
MQVSKRQNTMLSDGLDRKDGHSAPVLFSWGTGFR